MRSVPARIGRYYRTRDSKCGRLHFLQARIRNPQAIAERNQAQPERNTGTGNAISACLYLFSRRSLRNHAWPAKQRCGSGNKIFRRAEMHLHEGGPLPGDPEVNTGARELVRACAAAMGATLDSPERSGPERRTGVSSPPPQPPRAAVRGMQLGSGVMLLVLLVVVLVLLVKRLCEAPQRRGLACFC